MADVDVPTANKAFVPLGKPLETYENVSPVIKQ